MLSVFKVIYPKISPAGIAERVSIIGLPKPAIDVWISAEINVVTKIAQRTQHFSFDAKPSIPLNKYSQPI